MDPVEQNQKSNKGIVISIIALFLVAGGVFFTFKYVAKDSTQNPVPVSTDNNANIPVILNSKYKDGSYSADGNYQSPGGTEFIKVTLVLKNNIITDATVVIPSTTRSESKYFQDIFAKNFKQYVVGKDVNEVNLTKVSGSSLTPSGFNDSIAKIKVQAKI